MAVVDDRLLIVSIPAVHCEGEREGGGEEGG